MSFFSALFTQVVSLCLLSCAFASVKSIRIEGNKRVERETILSLVTFSIGENADEEVLNKSFKKLFETGFFKEVQLKMEGDTVVIKVQENPVINRIAVEGNDKIKSEDLLKEIQIKPREVASVARLQEIQQRLLELYRHIGRFNATVTPKIVNLDENRVDLVFEITEGPITQVREITFIGNKTFSKGKLEEEISSKRVKWYRLFSNDDLYDAQRFSEDQQLLQVFYENNGFLDFKILSSNAELTVDRSSFSLTFVLSEGPRYTIDKTEIQTNLKNIPLDLLKCENDLSKGDVFSHKDVDRVVERMTDLLSAKNIHFVSIEPRLDKDPNTQKVNVIFEIKPAQKRYVDKIIITGNDQTRDEVVRRELLFHEGDALNLTRVKRSEQRVKDLGFFKTVKIVAQQSPTPDRVNLVIQVEEQSTGELNLSGGYSTVDRFLASFRIVQRNFRGTGQTVSLDTSLSQKRQDVAVGIMEPYFLDKDLSASANVFLSNSSRVKSYQYQTNGFSVAIGYRLSENVTQSISYGLKFDNTSNLPKDVSPIIYSQKGKFLSSWVGHTISYDRRDSRLHPTKGYYFGLTTTFSGLGGSVKYLKNEFFMHLYKKITDDVILSFEGHAGHLMGWTRVNTTKNGVNTRENVVRVVDSFLIGEQTFRGFEYGGVGPRDLNAISRPKNQRGTPGASKPKDVFLVDDALGGTRYWTGSVELSFPLGLPTEFGVKGALFSDFGSVWKAGQKKAETKDVAILKILNKKLKSAGKNTLVSQIADKNKIRVSLGAGVSWDSPFGPIRVDYAIPVKKAKHDREQRLLFGYSTKF